MTKIASKMSRLLVFFTFGITLTNCASLYSSKQGHLTQGYAGFSKVRDITLGMNTDAVAELWGEPDTIESAGAGGTRYQRWVYKDNPMSHLQIGNTRVIYFDNGHVTGWETRPENLSTSR